MATPPAGLPTSDMVAAEATTCTCGKTPLLHDAIAVGSQWVSWMRSTLGCCNRRAMRCCFLRAVAVCGSEDVILHAQTYIRDFYEDCGFQPVGEVFDEAGIPHIRMVKRAGS